MENWTEGYVTEIEYTHGYYRELAPSIQRFAVLLAGYAPPPDTGASLELGFGQGISAAIHAAATPGHYWGTDFNPTQVAHAVSLVQASGSDARMLDDSFAELASRTDLPKFDFIGAHGIWSWISRENRAHLTTIMRKHLAVGGIAYVSYNSLPGWSAALSLRHLLTLHAETAGAEAQGVAGRIDAALAFAQQLVGKNAAYFQANPLVAARLKEISGQDRHYLAHEYFNRDWDPMPFSELVEWLSPAKLEFAASAHLMDHVGSVNLTPGAREMLAGIHHPVLRESIRDYFVNQQFRRDLFMRGARHLTRLDREEALLATSFTLLSRVEDIAFTVDCAIGKATLNENVYRPLIEALTKKDYRPRTLAEVKADLPGMNLADLVEAVTLLVGAGHLHPAQSEAVIKQVQPRTRALNAELCKRARSTGNVSVLASPVIGSGVTVGRLQQLFLISLAEGRKTQKEWAEDAWKILGAQNQVLLKDGKTLEGEEGNLKEMGELAKAFAEKRLPLLKSLGIA